MTFSAFGAFSAFCACIICAFTNYVNLCIIKDVLTIKDVFTTIRVVWASGSLRFCNSLISKHMKHKGINNLFSKLGFYKMTF